MQHRCQAGMAVILGLGLLSPGLVFAGPVWSIVEGHTIVTFDPMILKHYRLQLRATDPTYRARRVDPLLTMEFVIDSRSDLALAAGEGTVDVIRGDIQHVGGLTLVGPQGKQTLDPLVLVPDPSERTLGWLRAYGSRRGPDPGLLLVDTNVSLDPLSRNLVIRSDAVMLSRRWAAALGCGDLEGVPIGSAVLRARVVATDALPVPDSRVSSGSAPAASMAAGSAGSIGPDVIVGSLPSIVSWGSESGISVFSVGTTSCNLGDQPVLWIAGTRQHPVISQSMFRMKDDRFEQIGLAWVKHGFAALAGEVCGGPCQDVPGSDRLGVGCSDPYSAFLNGAQNGLGPRSQVNAYTGWFVFPRDLPNPSCIDCGPLERRIQVANEDVDPALNPGARYFVEGHYVTEDDALAGNGTNNASYRPATITVGPSPGNSCSGLLPDEFCARTTGGTQREQPGIRAWQDSDPAVVETDVPVPGEGLFILAVKTIDLGDGFWQYEYALQNLNSDRSGRSFSIPLSAGTVVEGIGFHDVDSHSGELDYPSGLPLDTTDWPATVTNVAITWSTSSFDSMPNANALRWGALYNFWFRANVAPADTTATIGLFKPGLVGSVTASTVGPTLTLIDCNDNGAADACDIDCMAFECTYPCGQSADCNGNGVPDECEPDCNNNGVADGCDLAWGRSDDCDGNMVPDECQPDCDGDGIPDACDVVDTDADGIADCLDLCPETTPPDSCVCPDVIQCCTCSTLDPICGLWTRTQCLAFGCMPECVESPCRDGCLMGDYDKDGDLDLLDIGRLLWCFSGPGGDPAFVAPTAECLLRFDFDDDGDVDLDDYDQWDQATQKGP